MKNMVDYQDHYLKKDVLLLAGVFEKFTSESFKFKKKKRSISLFQLPWIELGYNVKNDWNKIKTNLRHKQQFIS